MQIYFQKKISTISSTQTICLLVLLKLTFTMPCYCTNKVNHLKEIMKMNVMDFKAFLFLQFQSNTHYSVPCRQYMFVFLQ